MFVDIVVGCWLQRYSGYGDLSAGPLSCQQYSRDLRRIFAALVIEEVVLSGRSLDFFLGGWEEARHFDIF